jgi:sec-independent protein translocase protein TatA
MIYGLGMQELLVILAIVMLLFGGKKLPEVGRNLGKAIRGFKESEEETTRELKAAAEKETADEAKGDEATEGEGLEGTEQDKVENEKKDDEAT